MHWQVLFSVCPPLPWGVLAARKKTTLQASGQVMALTLTQLAAELPSGTIVVDSTGQVVIKVGLLTGQPGVNLSEPLVSDVLVKLHAGAVKAQSTYNATAQAQNQLTSYSPARGAAPIGESVSFVAQFTYKRDLSNNTEEI